MIYLCLYMTKLALYFLGSKTSSASINYKTDTWLPLHCNTFFASRSVAYNRKPCPLPFTAPDANCTQWKSMLFQERRGGKPVVGRMMKMVVCVKCNRKFEEEAVKESCITTTMKNCGGVHRCSWPPSRPGLFSGALED